MITTLLYYSCTKNEEESYSWQPVVMNDGLKVCVAAEQGLDPITIDIHIKKQKI